MPGGGGGPVSANETSINSGLMAVVWYLTLCPNEFQVEAGNDILMRSHGGIYLSQGIQISKYVNRVFTLLYKAIGK